jgi:hypothetical protein
MSLEQWIYGILAALIVGISKTGVPGIGILAPVSIALVLGGRESVGATLPMLIFADLFAVRWFRQYTRWDKVTQLMPYVVVGMLVGAVTLFVLGESQSAKDGVNVVIGVMVLAMLSIHLARLWLGNKVVPTSRAALGATGVASGFATAVSNAAGPLMNIYMTSLNLSKNEFMGTTAWYFLIFNTSKVPLYLLLDWLNPARPLFTSRGLLFAFLLLPIVLVGVFIGRWLLAHVSQRVFNIAVIVLATVGAIRLIVS